MGRFDNVTPIMADPYLDCGETKVWAIDLNAYVQWRRDQNDELFAEPIALYLVEAPWAHPVIHSYTVSVIHLREASAKKPITVYLDGATHELAIASLRPKCNRNLLVDGDFSEKPVVFPLNFSAQFIADSDEIAAARVWESVLAITRQDISPDRDFMEDWIIRYNSSMVIR